MLRPKWVRAVFNVNARTTEIATVLVLKIVFEQVVPYSSYYSATIAPHKLVQN